jgi:hypothetical protein
MPSIPASKNTSFAETVFQPSESAGREERQPKHFAADFFFLRSEANFAVKRKPDILFIVVAQLAGGIEGAVLVDFFLKAEMKPPGIAQLVAKAIGADAVRCMPVYFKRLVRIAEDIMVGQPAQNQRGPDMTLPFDDRIGKPAQYFGSDKFPAFTVHFAELIHLQIADVVYLLRVWRSGDLSCFGEAQAGNAGAPGPIVFLYLLPGPPGMRDGIRQDQIVRVECDKEEPPGMFQGRVVGRVFALVVLLDVLQGEKVFFLPAMYQLFRMVPGAVIHQYDFKVPVPKQRNTLKRFGKGVGPIETGDENCNKRLAFFWAYGQGRGDVGSFLMFHHAADISGDGFLWR